MGGETGAKRRCAGRRREMEKYLGVRNHYSRGVREGNWVEELHGEGLLSDTKPLKFEAKTTAQMSYVSPQEMVSDVRACRGAPPKSEYVNGIETDLLFGHGPTQTHWKQRYNVTSKELDFEENGLTVQQALQLETQSKRLDMSMRKRQEAADNDAPMTSSYRTSF